MAGLAYVLVIVVTVTAGVVAAGLVDLLMWRWRRSRKDAAALCFAPGALSPLHGVERAARPLPEPRPAIERAPEVYLHVHGVSAEDVAAIGGSQQERDG